jgi:hypothetical protein
MPMANRLLASALKAVCVEVGVRGATPDKAPPYAAIANFTCESAQAFVEAITPCAPQLQADIP